MFNLSVLLQLWKHWNSYTFWAMASTLLFWLIPTGIASKLWELDTLTWKQRQYIWWQQIRSNDHLHNQQNWKATYELKINAWLNNSLRIEAIKLTKQNLTFDLELLDGHRGFNSKSDLAWIMPRGKLLKLLKAAPTS